MLTMKGLFWNSNGLRDQAKPRFLFDLTKEQLLDFITILETKNRISVYLSSLIFVLIRIFLGDGPHQMYDQEAS
jgi:hypothetical protein